MLGTDWMPERLEPDVQVSSALDISRFSLAVAEAKMAGSGARVDRYMIDCKIVSLDQTHTGLDGLSIAPQSVPCHT